jgi:hypothetical protein
MQSTLSSNQVAYWTSAFNRGGGSSPGLSSPSSVSVIPPWLSIFYILYIYKSECVCVCMFKINSLTP